MAYRHIRLVRVTRAHARGPDPFLGACLAAGLPAPVPEFRFHPGRCWRLDYAWPDHKLALEVEGGVWTGGRHTRGAGFLRDMEKYNALAVAGWRLLRCTPADVRGLKVLAVVKDAFEGAVQ